ncbi:hypothetical protein LSAT2_023297 [Lamellibrachia satsuma]|nr:hypothetical protein LSAT2_023297 [Lamellibrachia satsuma]
MASSQYGRKLNPYRSLLERLGIKGLRQSVSITNIPSTIDQNQQLLVRFPNFRAHDVIVSGKARLAFTISLTSAYAKSVAVQNFGQAVVKKTTIKIDDEVMSIDDSDVCHCYNDIWLTKNERQNMAYQGTDERRIDTNINMLMLRVGVGDGNAAEGPGISIADAYGNRFHILLDFELLDSHMPF